MSSKLIKLNKYTLMEIKNNLKIYFFPVQAITDIVATEESKNNSIYILFELDKEKENKTYCMRTSLINNENKTVIAAYGLYLKEIDTYKYSINENKIDIAHAEILPCYTIDFTKLDFNEFTNLFTSIDKLKPFLGELKNLLVKSQEQLKEEKDVAKTIDIPTLSNYYQNISGNIIKRIEDILLNLEEQNISYQILKKLKKNYEVILNDEEQTKTSYLSLYGAYLSLVKSQNTKPHEILSLKELKPDTNKTSMSLTALNNVLSNYIESLKKEENNEVLEDIIAERILYNINLKSSKEVTNYLKIILIDDKYLDPERKVRAAKEIELKDLILNCLYNFNYRPLPHNEILIYNQNNNIIDFVCILSLDKLLKIFKSYRMNSADNNKSIVEIVRLIDKKLRNQKLTPIEEIELLIRLLIAINLYKQKQIDNKFMLFNKGDYILNLGYKKGNYNITVINKITKKEIARFIKLTKETLNSIKESLDKGEKSFNLLMNSIVFSNFEYALYHNLLTIKIDSLTHHNIHFILKRIKATDLFEINIPLDEFLLIFASLKQISPSKKITIEEDNNYIYGINKNDYDYIIRKSKAIKEVMDTNPIENKEYQEISKIYSKLYTSKNKKELLIKLATLLNIELVDIEQE